MVARGYTLIEILVVLAIIGVLAVVVFTGISGYNKNQYLSNAQREFLTALRGTQNRVLNGANTVNYEVVTVNTNSYQIGNNSPVSLPPGITVASTVPTCLYFANPLLTTNAANSCGTANCAAGAYFGCVNGVLTSSGSLSVTFTNDSTSKTVVIEGSGMTINRVYAQ